MPEFDCEHCGRRLKASETQIGRRVRCPRCGGVSTVPPQQEEPAALPLAEEAVGRSGGVSGRPGAPAPLQRLADSPAPPTAFSSFSPVAGRRYGFNCQYCSSRLEATNAIAGQEGQCPTCGNTIVIPILDRYGRLIDPMTGKVIKQDPHPVHAYAAAGERAPRILRDNSGRANIGCPRCGSINLITANNCKHCGMPFTMEGTTLEAAGSTNGFCTASLVLGIIGLPTFCIVVIPLLAVVFGAIGLQQTQGLGGGGGRGLAIAGLACGGIGLVLAMFFWLGQF